MRTSILGLSAVALAAVATPALAQEATGSANDLTITGGASLVTDYRFRGVSQTDESFAVQGTLGVSHTSGFYAGVWGSSVDFAGADYNGDGISDETITSEIDLYAGYKVPVGPATADVGVVYYYYPDAGVDYKVDYAEIYASLSGSVGPASAKIGAAYAPKMKSIADLNGPNLRDDNLYVYGDLAYSLGDVAPLTVKAHLGSSFGRSFLTFGKKSYLDWSVGADYTWKNLTLGVSYVDTDLRTNPGRNYYSYDAADSTVIGSITVAF